VIPNDEGLWVVVPAFQEAAVIAATLGELLPVTSNVVVVDDGSSDDTADRARATGACVLRHILNLGQGAALQTGIDYALERGARYVCTFDADGQHDVRTIAAMLELAKTSGADVVLGSRFLGATEGMSLLRGLVLKAAIAFTRLQTGLPLTDTHNGLRLFSASALARVRIEQPGMAHASELLDRIAKERLHVVELPTTVRYTDYSKAKGQKLSQSVRIMFDLLYAAWSR
jgi:glycosyltransferase involved in cell wall biosynthesis